MSNSYLQNVILPCKNCGQNFETKVWMIVDTSEHPEVVRNIIAGSHFKTNCSHCSYEILMEVPLLTYQPDREPHLIYTPFRLRGEEDNEYYFKQFTKRLRKSLGRTWQKNWESQIAIIQREMLPFTLSRDPNDQKEILERMLTEAANRK